jgi:hypothetical protein
MLFAVALAAVAVDGDLIGSGEDAPGPDRISFIDLGSFLHFCRARLYFYFFGGFFYNCVTDRCDNEAVSGSFATPLRPKKKNLHKLDVGVLVEGLITCTNLALVRNLCCPRVLQCESLRE